MTLARMRAGGLLAALATFLGSCGNKCEDATIAMKMSIDKVCAEPEFANTPFCTCCRPNGFYSIDETCTCQPLVFDADFCYYDPSSSGYPHVRRALTHAANVCVDRTAVIPFGSDAGSMCSTQVRMDAAAPDDAVPSN